MKKITDFLQQLGLSEIEAILYKGLLETGATTVKELSEHVGIKRITAHFNVERLIEKGLITQIKKGLKRQIVAEPPDRLTYLIQQKEQEIDLLKSNLPDTINSLYNIIPSKDTSGVEVKYYEGKKNVLSLYHETLYAQEVYSFADLEKYYEVFPNTLDIFVNALENNPKRVVWDILIDSAKARKIIGDGNYERYNTKFLPRSNLFSGFSFADYIIYDDKIAIVQLDPHKPQATMIQSSHIALSLKALHQTMWQFLPE